MLPGLPLDSLSGDEKRLRSLYRQLLPEDRAALLRFAEFLATSPLSSTTDETSGQKVFPQPESIARPEQESVVKAIKRLVATYPMIRRDRLLNETSSLMTAHVIHGKAAPAVIDELEALFERHYQELKTAFESQWQLPDPPQQP